MFYVIKIGSRPTANPNINHINTYHIPTPNSHLNHNLSQTLSSNLGHSPTLAIDLQKPKTNLHLPTRSTFFIDGPWQKGLSGKMSIISWNCRGLDNLSVISILFDIIQTFHLDIIFLCETLMNSLYIEEITNLIGFDSCLVVDMFPCFKLWNSINYKSYHSPIHLLLDTTCKKPFKKQFHFENS